jgi:hypothetical protein
MSYSILNFSALAWTGFAEVIEGRISSAARQISIDDSQTKQFHAYHAGCYYGKRL